MIIFLFPAFTVKSSGRSYTAFKFQDLTQIPKTENSKSNPIHKIEQQEDQTGKRNQGNDSQPRLDQGKKKKFQIYLQFIKLNKKGKKKKIFKIHGFTAPGF